MKRIFEVWFLLPLLLLNEAGHTNGSSAYPNCAPGYATEDELGFSELPGNYSVTCEGAYVELLCCVKGYRSMKWYKKDNGIWKEIKQYDQMYYQKNDLNQTLTIQNPYDKEKFQGLYMCVAQGRNNWINNTIQLDIRDCAGQVLSPEAVLSMEGTIARRLGSSVHIRCGAFFGFRHEKTLSDIYWHKSHYNSSGHLITDIWIPRGGSLLPTATNINITYEVHPAHIYSTIIISNITKNDYGNYTCQMMNVVGTIYSSTELLEDDGTVPTVIIVQEANPTWQLAVIVVLVCFVVVIIGLVIYCIHKKYSEGKIDFQHSIKNNQIAINISSQKSVSQTELFKPECSFWVI